MNQRRIHVSKEETFIKWVKRLRLSAFTTSQPRTFFWLWLMLVMWCYEYIIQFIVMVPSSSYYIIRTEILILQWNKAGMTFLNWNQLWLWNLFAILNVRVLCRWSSSATAVWSPAATGSGVPLIVRALRRGSRDGSDAARRGVGSVEQAQVRDQPELHFTITESLFKVFVRVLIAIAKQMTRTISCCHDISPCSTPVRTSPW